MRMHYVPCVIFSVYKDYYSKQWNQNNAMMAENDLKRLGIDFEKVLGVYQGSEEMSYIVSRPTPDQLRLIIGMAKIYDQDSILLRDNENNCTLKYFDSRPMQAIGKLEQVSIEDALKSDAYTYSPRLKQYFVCR